MSLYLVQHGQCLSKDQDPKKGLSADGTAETERIAQVAADYGILVDCIHHSGKKRAAQTAEILAAALSPSSGITAVEGIKPLDDVPAYAGRIDLSQNIMLVGHLPFLEKLAAYLITGQVEPPVFRLQNSGILCLDRYPESDQIVIKWALIPSRTA